MSLFYSKQTHTSITDIQRQLCQEFRSALPSGCMLMYAPICFIDKKLYFYFDHNHEPISLEYHGLKCSFSFQRQWNDDIEITIPEQDKFLKLKPIQQPFSLEYNTCGDGCVFIRTFEAYDSQHNKLFELEEINC